MAYEDNQNELPLPGEQPQRRESARHLPKYFRTDKNTKFLQSTLDQLLQPGVAEKVNAFVGRKTAKAFKSENNYLEEVSNDRQNYQLEPVSVIKDNIGNVEYLRDYMDYIHQIGNFGGVNNNHSRSNRQEFYAWDPHIDWDKFTNFREYYWLPTGPQTVVIPGEQKEITSTYTVNLQAALGDYSYVFTPDGATNNPTIKLFRGVTYRFEINTPGLPFTIRTARTLDNEFLLNEGVSAQAVEQGVIEVTLGPEAPNEIWYVAENDINIAGLIRVANQEESTFIDVETEIVGKKFYTTRDGWSLTNGLKVRFAGEVTPSKYANSEWYIEGVGDKIKLVSDKDVEVSFPVGIDLLIPFDDGIDGFDSLPYSAATGYPRDKDYITINRSSGDGNFWSRYNRWFHKDVIEISAQVNGVEINIDQSLRANRPIIEFEAGLKLYNFGTRAKQVVDVIDDYTTDAFSTIEGSLGYNIDSVQLVEGMRVLFLADTDPLVRGKIFEVKFIQFKGSGTAGQISLVETDDSDPVAGENVLVTQGELYSGSMWYYDGRSWNRAQEKTAVNQPPVFDVYDVDGVSYSDTSVYNATSFRGTKLFSFREGTGTADNVLGFPLTYRSINNVGDIVFDFNFNSDVAEYQVDDNTFFLNIRDGFLRKYVTPTQYELVGAYCSADSLSEQEVILQYVNDGTKIRYPIDCYTQSALMQDLSVKVFVNNNIVYEGIDYELVNTSDKLKSVRFLKNIENNANIIIKTKTATPKNQNGYYEIAPNLERNPLNENVTSLTLGEVTDHVSGIVQNVPGFDGIFPGPSNLRDISNQSRYGRKFIKNSAPLNLAMYSLLDKDSNLIKSIRYARKEYSKFKRLFIETAETLGYDGPIKIYVDKIIEVMTRDKINTMPFYFSDMFGFGAAITTRITIEDQDANFYALTTPFTLEDLSTRAVTVYLNDTQLLHGRDYVFNTEGYLEVTASKSFGDILEINEYEVTNGTYVPPTPTKLGLWPKFEPQIYNDDTYPNSPLMIRGHDGSIIRAYEDFRDDLILELEKRIFNNIKVDYDSTVFDVKNYMPGAFRNTGFSREDVYKPMIADFVQWLQLVDEDYTQNRFYDRLDSFTWNYSNMRSPAGDFLPGWWRGAYRYVYDTDRPHTQPWEMLGFSIKPDWWEEQYGPAPYTSENLLLWEDLEKGIIREPGKPFKINSKYARPGLTNWLPVDRDGVLLSPSDANLPQRFNSLNLNDPFIFGDSAPVENAWTNSSDFAFAVLTSWAINSPSSLLSTAFDRSRQIRNELGQLVYKPTMEHLQLKDLVFPNTPEDKTQILTAGLVNYISGFMSSNITSNYTDYKRRLKAIKNCLAFKLGGFTDKKKFKLILDSRTPLNQGNVFVPEENYQIILNTSSPIKTVNYSGVIIEKRAPGFIIRGYNKENPVFKWYRPISTNKDINVNVGGVSEPFINWEANQYYVQGKNVQYQDTYYKVVETHTATATFDPTKYTKLPKLPTIGGADAVFKERFYDFEEETLAYGTNLRTVQDVVDFLLGYEAWLKTQGFRFEYYDGENQVLSDWKNSCREFMFWTTQNWSEGALIALSPVADEINFETEYSTVDNIFDNFYGYSLLKADGKKLVEEFTRISRQEANKFKIRPKSTGDGVYAVQIPIITKEHVVLLDNTTIFGDIIYQPPTGYRQDRVRILGYRTVDWDGSLNIPGFIYNQASVTEWQQWKDYQIGDLIKYKQFYYSANNKIVGSEVFDSSQWTRLKEKPENEMLTNFEYKVNQFADFYDLDTDNFDTEQQRFAQHLIGYQDRQYLENIINDEVSQYKFYQGMIREKGTLNSLNKLFDVLSEAGTESLDFYEEWAVKQGQYGASEGFNEVEFRLDESKMRIEPQPFLLTNNITGEETDLIYRIPDFEVFKKPSDYSSTSAFPVTVDLPQYTRTSGYVHIEDVDIVVPEYNDILNIPFSSLKNNGYVWVGSTGIEWNVYKHKISDRLITSLKGNATAVSIGAPDKNQFIIRLDNAPRDINVGDIIGIYDLVVTEKTRADSSAVEIVTQNTEPVEGFFKVLQVELNEVIIETEQVITDIDSCRGLLTLLKPVRARQLSDANAISQLSSAKDDLIWIDDDGTGNWRVIKNTQPFNLLQRIPAEDAGLTNNFAQSLTVDGRNVTLAVSSPTADDNGKIFVYTRGGNNQNFQFTQILEPIDNLADIGQGFGKGLALSSDGKYLIVGSPDASNVKTNFTGDYSETADYQNGKLVRYSDQIWEAIVDINGAKAAQPFGSFGAIIEVIQKNNITGGEIPFNNLLAGKYPFTNVTTDHILVRAPADAYRATGPGDTVFLDWYLQTTANQSQVTLADRQPFNGTILGVDESYLESGLTVQKKIDVVLFVNSISTLPTIGAQIETEGVFGYVAYVYQEEGQVTIYVENSAGVWPGSGSLFLETGEFIGEYDRLAPTELNEVDTSDDLGGYWWFDTTDTISVGTTNEDEGRGLAVYNIVPLGKVDVGAAGGNIYDYNNTEIFEGDNSINSFIRTFTYQGTPGAYGNFDVIESDLFAVRAPKSLTDKLNVIAPGNPGNDEVGLVVVNLPNLNDGTFVNITPSGLTYVQTNKKHTLYDLWDGYIEFALDQTDEFGRPFEPLVGQFVRDRRTGATAQIAVYQRKSLSATIFVKSVIGDWSLGTNHGEPADLEMLGDPANPSPIYSVTRTLGDIKTTSLGSDNLGIGGLCVFQLSAPIEEVPETDTIIGAEYLVYKDFEILGLPTDPNIPSADNPDWKIVYNVPVNADGDTLNIDNYGMYTVYIRENISTFTPLGTYIVPEQIDGLRIGTDIKIARRNDLYKAFIGCEGNGTNENPGRIYFLNNGVDEEGILYNWELAKDKRYKGPFGEDKNYFIGDIVFFDGEFYLARTNIASGDAFNDLDWEVATNDQIRSVDFVGYVPNDTDLVPRNPTDLFGSGADSSLQIEKTNLFRFGRDFDVSDDAEVLIAIAEYQRPAILDLVVESGRIVGINIVDGGAYYSSNPRYIVDDGLDDSTIPTWENSELQNEIVEIDFTVTDGVITAATVVKGGRSFTENARVILEPAIERRVIVYRNINDNYQKYQEVILNVDTSDINISISQDGTMFAVGTPNADTVDGQERGAVYVYTQVNGEFVLSQTLTSTVPIRGEYFGGNIDFDGRTLFISAFNASSDDITLFDTYRDRLYPESSANGLQYVLDTTSPGTTATTFDNGFTNFRNTIPNNGVVYAYDRIENSLVLGQTIDFNVVNAKFFGRKIYSKNNHLYVSLPAYVNDDSKVGLVLDYRRPDTTRLWNTIRQPERPVDVEKIKRVVLYDLDKNVILENLDYIDPVQGKIAGPADEEIRWKTPFDPATYNVGTSAVDVDETEFWGADQVGQVWWDLSTAKFLNVYQGNTIYKTNNFNELSAGSSIDVYEWVESKYTPARWDELTVQPEGEALGVTGTTKYGPGVYAQKRVYDTISQTFTTYYYYWVKNKKTTPNVQYRQLSIETITKLIEDPSAQGYRFVSLLDKSTFALHNCDDLIRDKSVVLSIQYWTYSNKNSNIHNQYQILTEGLGSSKPYKEIEEKWFDSLIGYDRQTRPVPDPDLSVKEKYGILNKPRQSWFVNKTEALKQLVERVNAIFLRNLIVDEKDITSFLDSDPAPTEVTRLYDTIVDTDIDLQFVGVARAADAVLSPVIQDGKLIEVSIINPGRGYRVAPTYEIDGLGSGAELEIIINNLGQITEVIVSESGNNYNENTTVTVRPFAVLVRADNQIRGNWAIYHRNNVSRSWVRVNSQAYDVTKYWNYADWYADGYNEFTEIDHVIEQSYGLESLNDSFGDVVKILNVGGEGWLLLEKIDNQDTVDYTVNYKTIGKQNGTIQLSENLYNFDASRVGFDTQTFDTQFFDSQPVAETRIILEALRDDILVNDLSEEYNKLFFASLRYVFAEQGYVDWAFKTSFIKAQHNVGPLRQRITFKNDALVSYEDYIKEVKPYKSKIREYVSNYADVENSSSAIIDFDNPPKYDRFSNSIETSDVRVINGILSGTLDRYNTYPDKFWIDNASYKISDIVIGDPGSGYLSAPKIEIEGNATAVASLGPGGKISSVKIINPGSGYVVAPEIVVNGTVADGGTPAKLSAVLGDSLVRTIHTTIKFDRVSGTFFITQLNETETFAGTGGRTSFDLKWPMDMRTTTIEVLVNGELILNSQYEYDNYLNTDSGFDKYYGRVVFFDPPSNGSVIQVNYKKSIKLLDAQDRINLFYNPTTGQIGKDITQLMDGVDYGGVQVKSFNFSGPSGWDSDSWYTGSWDIFDDTFDEESFETDGSTLVFQLSKPLASGVKYNVYINGTRVDDDNWDGTTSTANLTNKKAFMAPVIGDGVTDTFTFENEVGYQTFLAEHTDSGENNPPKEIITLRKATSDGSLKPNEESYDTALNGGDLAYTTALGINAEDIVVDGDGFVTPTTAKGPEEVVPGQVLDTLDITVYERPYSGASLMQTTNFKGDGITKIFNLGQKPFAFENVIVKNNYGIIYGPSEYRVDYENNQIIFYDAPAVGDKLVIISMGVGGTNVLDYDEFVADGSTQDYLTNVKYSDTSKAFVTVNGRDEPFDLIQSDDTYAIENRCVIRFVQPPVENALIQFAIFDAEVQSFSQVTVDEIIADGSSSAYQISKAPFSQEPAAYNVIVTVDNKVLNAGYSESFVVEEDVLQYRLKVWQQPVGTVDGRTVQVYRNGTRLEFLQDWTFEGASSFNPAISPDAQPGSTVILNRGVAEKGDELKVYILNDGEYRFGFFDTDIDSTEIFNNTPDTIYFDNIPEENSIIRVYQFSNHDAQGIDRENYDIVQRTEMTVGSKGYFDYRLLKNGLLELRQEAFKVDYVWISLNGKWLTPTADYILLENKKYIKFITPVVEGDAIDIIHFSNPPISTKFGWRQFKDMLNRVHYKRLNKDDQYTLAEPLNWYDRSITLAETGGNLPTPDPKGRIPGVIFIEGERIEFFRREDNVLKQIRRGTLGTGIKDRYDAGTSLYNQSIDSTIPYKDNEEIVTALAGEYKDMRLVYPNDSADIQVDSIAYNFNNNTVFPLGGQVATVRGQGFRSGVTVFVQDIECSTTYVSSTELQFITPALPVGSYDLVIFNPIETTPIFRPSSSLVVSKYLPYVQILLPFAPKPNPATGTAWNELNETGWYKKPFNEGGIPEEYWEAQDIEVFANGKRLRKNPIKLYDVNRGQFSPDGDVWIEAEYAVNKNVGAYVRLTEPPEANTVLTIVRKQGQIWNEVTDPDTGAYKPLGQSQTEVATFLRGKSIDLPR